MRKQFGKARMSSVEMHHNSSFDKSGSPSPCRSPIVNQKPQRLLPANLYVALYNFLSRHEDEISLKAGSTITVTDTCGGCNLSILFSLKFSLKFSTGNFLDLKSSTRKHPRPGAWFSKIHFPFSNLNEQRYFSPPPIDPDWWVGKSYGAIGYFPSKYVAKLYPGKHLSSFGDSKAILEIRRKSLTITKIQKKMILC